MPQAHEYPHPDGDVTVLGPEIFASVDEQVISWKGTNYVPQQIAKHWEDAADANGRLYSAAENQRDTAREAVAELAQAIRLTREYVGEELLPAVEGWSWYDALLRHAPHELPTRTGPAPQQAATTKTDPKPDFTSPIAGRVEVRQPCPHCGDRQMIPRTQFDEHVARLHPDVKPVRAKTIAVDFDGVIHAYSKGWQDGTIYDPPLPGALEALNALMETYAVFIHTSRSPESVAAWLATHGFSTVVEADVRLEFWNARGTLLVTDRKLPAVAYIDDRGIRFRHWEQALHDLANVV